MQSLVARADALLGVPPKVSVSLNEKIIVGDINLFTLPVYWGVTPVGSTFSVTLVELSTDGHSVLLTGNFLTDSLIDGNTIIVTFNHEAAMLVTDEAGNVFKANPNIITGAVTP